MKVRGFGAVERRYSLPSLRKLVAMLRESNTHFDGPGNVALEFADHDGTGPEWRLMCMVPGEAIPGDGRRFDAVGVARRVLARAKDDAS